MEPTVETRPARELSELIASNLRGLTSTRDQMRRQLAAAGLARCRSLLMALCSLDEMGHSDVLGLLLRAVFETWAVSLWVLYKGSNAEDDAVLQELGSDYEHWTTRMAKATGWKEGDDEAEKAMNGWRTVAARAGGKPLNYRAIVEELEPLLTGDRAMKPGPIAIYDRVYRGQSIYCAHANLGTLFRYFAPDAAAMRDQVNMAPGPAFPEAVRLSALLTSHLATNIFDEFGIAATPLAEITARIGEGRP